MAPDPNLRYASARSLLLGRDSCSEDFADLNGRETTCKPSQTKCCLVNGLSYPACRNYLSRGWCCRGGEDVDGCFADIGSVCDQPDAVRCTNLTKGVKEACCPRGTNCVNNREATVGKVRCNARHTDLIKLDASASSTAPATSTTTSGAGETGNPQDQGALSGPSVGLIAGASVGGTLGFVALVVLGYLLFRKWSKKRRPQAGYSPPPNLSSPGMTMSQSPSSQQAYSTYQDYGHTQGGGGAAKYERASLSHAPVELNAAEGNRDPAELPTER